MYKIAVTGPESTGKTSLSNELGEILQLPVREEIARTYLSQIGLAYSQIYVEEIATLQCKMDKELLLSNQSYIADTEMMVIYLWMKIRYQSVPEWIVQLYENQLFDLYLLCDIDIVWEKDNLREHAHLRLEIFNLMKEELQRLERKYFIISGLGDLRTHRALESIKDGLGIVS